ncbi:hypothetical protein AX16_006287 [Volvariella volvacea WC 439]|nr:hypothetical protein AX16_006287 [Volvariella volvacea WC 439]
MTLFLNKIMQVRKKTSFAQPCDRKDIPPYIVREKEILDSIALPTASTIPMFSRLRARSWSRSGRRKDSGGEKKPSTSPVTNVTLMATLAIGAVSTRTRIKPRKSSLPNLLIPRPKSQVLQPPKPQVELRLPPELEREVFELAARQNRKMVTKLNLVCHRAHIWINPILYEMVTLMYPESADKFIHAAESKPEGWMNGRVKTLCMSNFIRREQAARILSICGAVDNLACWIRQAVTVPNIHDQRPRRLSINASGVPAPHDTAPPPSPNFQDPLFEQVTHLALSDNWEVWSKWAEGLSHIPNLSHLELRVNREADLVYIREELALILTSCAKLRVLILLVAKEPGSFVGLTAIGDPRVAILRNSSLLENWEAHPKGEADRWVHAEAVVKKQTEIYRASRSGSPEA